MILLLVMYVFHVLVTRKRGREIEERSGRCDGQVESWGHWVHERVKDAGGETEREREERSEMPLDAHQ